MKNIFLVSLVFVTIVVLTGCTREPYKYDAFATCLTEKGASMYGTEWCPYCKKQKKLFGPSIDLVDYNDCEVEVGKCRKAELDGYPTWIFQDGTRLAGTQSLTALAEKTGCQLPE